MKKFFFVSISISIILLLFAVSKIDKLKKYDFVGKESIKKGTGIYLETSIQSQLERTMNDKHRPLLQRAQNKEETLREIAKLRNPLYLKCSDIVIKETNNPNETVDLILQEIEQIK